MSSSRPSDEQLAQMERACREHNEMVRSREECRVCERDVPDADFDHKFAAAGGCLAGPFCSRDCYWRWMLDDE